MASLCLTLSLSQKKGLSVCRNFIACTLIVVLSWPEDGRSRPKHVANHNLIVIIASCLDVFCVLTVHNILYKYDIRNGMASLCLTLSLSLKKKKGLSACRNFIVSHEQRNAPITFLLSLRPSLCQHVSARFPLDGFLWNLMETLTKTCSGTPNFVKIGQKCRCCNADYSQLYNNEKGTNPCVFMATLKDFHIAGNYIWVSNTKRKHCCFSMTSLVKRTRDDTLYV